MSTRPLPPPEVLRDDPGPWSVVSSVFAQAGRPGRRRAQPPTGLMLSPPPDIGRPLAGIDPGVRIAGLGPLTVIAAAREPALFLDFDSGGGVLRGVSPYVIRVWSVPDLKLASEERPAEDPAAALPGPLHPAALGEDELTGIAAPEGGVTAVYTREGRLDVIALVRESDRAIVRWVRGARAAAWSADGRFFALGGPWGVVLAQNREEA
jgi:hypothetical protein